MKVEKVKPKEVFVPIQITLESKGEADKMWHLLNYAPSYDGYTGGCGGLPKEITKLDLGCFHTELWRAFDLKHNSSDC